MEGTQRQYAQLTLKADTLKEQKLTETTGADKGKLVPTDVGSVKCLQCIQEVPDLLYRQRRRAV
ncbi:MAG: hypothetical protein U5L96_14450 [Owenweeksia sp.]|nr:hypothetical protein [Owenweeksia sp.]